MGCSIDKHHKKLGNTIEASKVHKVTTADLSIKPISFILKNEYDFTLIYRLGQPISQSHTAEVRICFLRETNEKRAVKIYKKDISQSKRESVLKEISILKSLDHPNIIRIYEYFESLSHIHIVMEYCSGGEFMTDIIKKHALNELQIKKFIRQILSATNYMHECGIVHRNTKPDNILLEDETEFAEIKLSDFGTATHYCQGMEERAGTLQFMSPEMIQGNYNEKCDIWSIGVITYLLFTGNLPFVGEENEIEQKILQGNVEYSGEVWDSLSEHAKYFTQVLLCREDSRLSAKEALNHPWLNEIQTVSAPKCCTQLLSNLTLFHYSSKLKQALATYLITQCVPNHELRELKEVFNYLDKDGDGKLSREEIMQYYLQDNGIEEAELLVQGIIDTLSCEKNEFISYSEFLAATFDQTKLLSLNNLKKAFEMFDKEGSGSNSCQEFKSIIDEINL